MRMNVLRLAQTVKVDKEDNIFYGNDYDMRAFWNPKIQATMIRIENTRKGKVVYTTFANVAYCEVDDAEFVETAPKQKANNAKA